MARERRVLEGEEEEEEVEEKIEEEEQEVGGRGKNKDGRFDCGGLSLLISSDEDVVASVSLSISQCLCPLLATRLKMRDAYR